MVGVPWCTAAARIKPLLGITTLAPVSCSDSFLDAAVDGSCHVLGMGGWSYANEMWCGPSRKETFLPSGGLRN
jgi:hypothetical protein